MQGVIEHYCCACRIIGFFPLRQAYEQNIHYPRNEFLFYGRYMRKNGGRLKTKDCPALLSKDKVYLVQPCLRSRTNSYLYNCSHLADSGIVSFPLNQLTAQIETPINFILDIHSYCRPNNIEYRSGILIP